MVAERLAARQHAYMPATLLDSQFAALEVPVDGIRLSIARRPDELVADILEQLAGYPR
jgi:gluconokinase